MPRTSYLPSVEKRLVLEPAEAAPVAALPDALSDAFPHPPFQPARRRAGASGTPCQTARPARSTARAPTRVGNGALSARTDRAISSPRGALLEVGATDGYASSESIEPAEATRLLQAASALPDAHRIARKIELLRAHEHFEAAVRRGGERAPRADGVSARARPRRAQRASRRVHFRRDRTTAARAERGAASGRRARGRRVA